MMQFFSQGNHRCISSHIALPLSLVLKYFTALSSSLLINVSKSVELRFSHEGEIHVFNFKENHRFIVECMICSNIHVTTCIPQTGMFANIAFKMNVESTHYWYRIPHEKWNRIQYNHLKANFDDVECYVGNIKARFDRFLMFANIAFKMNVESTHYWYRIPHEKKSRIQYNHLKANFDDVEFYVGNIKARFDRFLMFANIFKWMWSRHIIGIEFHTKKNGIQYNNLKANLDDVEFYV